jgi:DNA-binding PadR family transcriptional regulator
MAKDTIKPHVFYVLLALAEGDRHGLAIAREAQSLSAGSVKLWPATLYGTLDDLRTRKWIEEAGGAPRRRERAEAVLPLTRAGRAALNDEAERLAAGAARAGARPPR